MKVIVDFNGYYDCDKEYYIKEFSILSIDRLGKQNGAYSGFVTSNPRKYDITTQKNYFEYLEKHGITQTTNNFSNEEFTRQLDHWIKLDATIFVANNNQERFFRPYLKNGIHENELYYNFVLLDELGYKKAREAINICEYHKVSHPNCCANANAWRMMNFIIGKGLYSEYKLNGVHILIDFNGYGDIYLQIKEVAMVKLDHEGVPQKYKHYVTKPHYNNLILDWNSDLYEQEHGILRTTGKKKIKDVKHDLLFNLSYGVFIYVKNHSQKEILNEIDGRYSKKIICLDDFGYDIRNTEKKITECPYHKEPKTYNCANDNVKLMTDWLCRNKFYRLSKRIAFIQRHGLSQNPSSVSSQPSQHIQTSAIFKSNTGHLPNDYLHKRNQDGIYNEISSINSINRNTGKYRSDFIPQRNELPHYSYHYDNINDALEPVVKKPKNAGTSRINPKSLSHNHLPIASTSKYSYGASTSESFGSGSPSPLERHHSNEVVDTITMKTEDRYGRTLDGLQLPVLPVDKNRLDQQWLDIELSMFNNDTIYGLQDTQTPDGKRNNRTSWPEITDSRSDSSISFTSSNTPDNNLETETSYLHEVDFDPEEDFGEIETSFGFSDDLHPTIGFYTDVDWNPSSVLSQEESNSASSDSTTNIFTSVDNNQLRTLSAGQFNQNAASSLPIYDQAGFEHNEFQTTQAPHNHNSISYESSINDDKLKTNAIYNSDMAQTEIFVPDFDYILGLNYD